MATTLVAVNDASRSASLDPADSQRVDDHTPTTPKPKNVNIREPSPMLASSVVESHDASNPTTPTRRTFAGSTAETPGTKRGALDRQDSHDPTEDVEMGDAEQDDGEDDSDNDSVASDSKRPSKKKKGQRFFCTDFPPCQLSFTRSEHLARHIRKHTGERPFTCHCNRRFSRLDNLRQHAQTVHVNEEIPGDSLAATSTRFQRQIRTDRVRPPSSRSRASTLGSQGGHSRGHSRNLSTSSIGSTASSIIGLDDGRRRPQPLAMANDPTGRARLSINTYENPHANPGQPYPYYNPSPTGYSTPTSTTFSAGPGSPQLISPSASLSRSSYYNGARHTRRLSVPSGPHPFHAGGNAPYPASYYTPIPSATSSTFSQSGSMFGSPTSSVFSHNRHNSEADLEFRRRTWHPSTYSGYPQRPATSGLSYGQTPDDQRPERVQQPAASQVTRLPGIESFDHAPLSNARPPSSPMPLDGRPSSSGRPSTDHALHHGLTRLDLAAANGPEGGWHASGSAAAPPLPPPGGQGHQHPHHQHSMSMPENPVTPRQSKRQGWYGGPIATPTTYPPAYTPQRPSPEDSGSSDGVPTPSTSQGVEYTPMIVNAGNGAVEAYHPPSMMHPAMPEDPQMQKSAYYAQYPPSLSAQHGAVPQPSGPSQPTYLLQSGHDPRYPPHQYAFPSHSGPPPPGYPHHSAYPPAPSSQATMQPPANSNHDMGRLEALVAVATSEGRAAAAMEKGPA